MRRNSSAVGVSTGLATFVVSLLSAAGAFAQGTPQPQPSPVGVWIDHTGRGAVEITECGSGVCGHVVWIKDGKNAQGCGIKILSDVKPVGGNRWDNGKIYDPDQDSTFDVELTPIGADKLKVMGYAGVKFLSQTFTWRRAPADLKRCNDPSSVTAPTAPPPTQTTQKSEAAKPQPTPAEAAPSNKATMTAGTGSKESKAPENAQAKEDPVVPAVREPSVVAAAPEETAQKPEPDEDTKSEPRRKGKKQCKFKVPFGDIAVYYPCD